MVGIMSTTNKLRMEKCEDNIWERRVINSFPWSCQNGFLLAAFCWEHLTFHAKFPNKWKPKLQLVDQRCAGDFPPIPWCFPWKSPGWDDFPARTGILLQHWGSLRPGLFPSLHTRFSTLGLPVLSVGGSWRDVCVSQGLFLMPKDGDRAKIPRFFCGSDALTSDATPICPPHGCHHHSSGSNTQEKVPGRENWEFVYPNAVAVNWLRLFIKIFLGLDHSRHRQQDKHRWNPTPLKRNPSS